MRVVTIDVDRWGKDVVYDSESKCFCPLGFLAKQHYGDVFSRYLNLDTVKGETDFTSDLATAIVEDESSPELDKDFVFATMESIMQFNDEGSVPVPPKDRQFLVMEFSQLGFNLRFSDEVGR